MTFVIVSQIFQIQCVCEKFEVNQMLKWGDIASLADFWGNFYSCSLEQGKLGNDIGAMLIIIIFSGVATGGMGGLDPQFCSDPS